MWDPHFFLLSLRSWKNHVAAFLELRTWFYRITTVYLYTQSTSILYYIKTIRLSAPRCEDLRGSKCIRQNHENHDILQVGMHAQRTDTRYTHAPAMTLISHWGRKEGHTYRCIQNGAVENKGCCQAEHCKDSVKKQRISDNENELQGGHEKRNSRKREG